MRRDGKRVAADGKVVDKGFGIFPAGEFRRVCVCVERCLKNGPNGK